MPAKGTTDDERPDQSRARLKPYADLLPFLDRLVLGNVGFSPPVKCFRNGGHGGCRAGKSSQCPVLNESTESAPSRGGALLRGSRLAPTARNGHCNLGILLPTFIDIVGRLEPHPCFCHAPIAAQSLLIRPAVSQGCIRQALGVRLARTRVLVSQVRALFELHEIPQPCTFMEFFLATMGFCWRPSCQAGADALRYLLLHSPIRSFYLSIKYRLLSSAAAACRNLCRNVTSGWQCLPSMVHSTTLYEGTFELDHHRKIRAAKLLTSSVAHASSLAAYLFTHSTKHSGTAARLTRIHSYLSSSPCPSTYVSWHS